MSSPEQEIPRAIASGPQDKAGADEARYEHEGYQVLPVLTPLYSAGQVRGAAFFGGPFAAVWLLALNFSHLRQKHLIARTLIIGTIVTGLYFALAMALPDSFPGAPLYIGALLIAGKVAEWLQGEKYQRHIAAGGKRASNWKVAGISLATLLVTVGIVFGYSYAALMADSVQFGGGNEVYYEGGASKADAQKLGETLQELEFFTGDGPASVVLLHSKKKGFVVRFVVQDFAFSDTEVHAFFQEAGVAISIALNDRVTVQLAADYDDVRMTLPPLH